MNKIIFIFATLLFSTGAFARGGCDEGSLYGNFGYEVSGVNSIPVPGVGLVTRSTHVVGTVWFAGDGNASFKGVGSAAGVIREKTGVGTYWVNPDCTAEGKMTWAATDTSPAQTSTFHIILDQMDMGPHFNKPNHGYVLSAAAAVAGDSSIIPVSESGEMYRKVTANSH